MTIKEIIVAKLTSGKFLMTVAFTLTFCILAVMGKISADKMVEITLVIVYAYFTKRTENGVK